MQNSKSIIEELANLNPPKTEFNNKAVLNALQILGNPQFSCEVIHIAGTNGKGSTAAFIEEGLYQAGYKVGKYTSPYIHSLNECIRLNKTSITDQDLVQIYLATKIRLEQTQIYLSSFEMLTVIMFIYFKEQRIEYLVLEAGLGGRDDATNVVNSKFSIITNISLEHTQWLGNNLESISKHKAGIIKNGITILGANIPELIEAVKQKTNNFISIRDKYIIEISLDNRDFTTKVKFINRQNHESNQFSLSLFGRFQAYNFLCAYEVLSSLPIKQEIIAKSAANTIWPGRLQIIKHHPLIIADASHNSDGVKNLYDTLTGISRRDKCIIICSILKDKDYIKMLNWYCQITQNIIFCSIQNQTRAVPPIKLAKLAKGKFKNIYLIQSPQLALKAAQKLNKKLIIISGSTYLLKYIVRL